MKLDRLASSARMFVSIAAVSQLLFVEAADPARVRAEKLVAQMTQAEKFGFFQGDHNGEKVRTQGAKREQGANDRR